MVRERISRIVDSKRFQQIIVGLIILNSLMIGMETSDQVMNAFGHVIDQVDLVILGIFIVEILLKIYAHRISFFKSPWNLFDLFVILISVLPAAGSFTVFRALRILRTLRLVKNMPKLRLIIESLLYAIPSIGWIAVLLMVIFYIFAVIGTNLFGPDYPQWFGTLGDSMYTLFQIMTLESWSSGIARPIVEKQPLATAYFVVFILIATYTTLNIFIAIVVNTMNEMHMKTIEKDLQDEEEHIKEFVRLENEYLLVRMDRLTAEIQEVKELLLQENAINKEQD